MTEDQPEIPDAPQTLSKLMKLIIVAVITLIIVISGFLFGIFANGSGSDSRLSTFLKSSDAFKPHKPRRTEIFLFSSSNPLFLDKVRGNSAIMRYDASTSKTTRLSKPLKNYSHTNPKYSPDGKFIGFCHYCDSKTLSLRLFDENGNYERQIASVRSCSFDFTSDSKNIIYVGTDDIIYSIEIATRNIKVLFDSPKYTSKDLPMISRNGNGVYFIANENGSCYTSLHYSSGESVSHIFMRSFVINTTLKNAEISPDGNKMLLFMEPRFIEIISPKDSYFSNCTKLDHPEASIFKNVFWAPDGEHIYIERGEPFNDLIKQNVEMGFFEIVKKDLDGCGYSLKPSIVSESQQEITKVLFNRTDANGNVNVYLFNSYNGGVKQLTNNNNSFDAKFSHDGKIIAFATINPSTPHYYDLNLMNLEMNVTAHLVKCRSNGFNFVTNEYKIVYIGPDNGVYSIDIETRTETRLAGSDSTTKRDPLLSADGKVLYYSSVEWDKSSSVRRKEMKPDSVAEKIFNYHLTSYFVKLFPNGEELLSTNSGSVDLFSNKTRSYNRISSHFVAKVSGCKATWSWNGKWIYFFNTSKVLKIKSEIIRDMRSNPHEEPKLLTTMDILSSDVITDIIEVSNK